MSVKSGPVTTSRRNTVSHALLLHLFLVVVTFTTFLVASANAERIVALAIAGDHQGYAERAPISIDPDQPEGRGPTAVALGTNTPDVCNDIEGRFTRVSPRVVDSTGYTAEEINGIIAGAYISIADVEGG